jgi:hypothetical protein
MVAFVHFVNAQDAASEVFYNGGWHFYGLFDTHNFFNDHWTHYARWNKAYGMWVGVRRWTGSKPRFGMNSWAMNTSEVWQFAGYGGNENFIATSKPPLVSWSYPYLAYEWFSPVAAMVVLPDGRKIGASGSIDLNGFRDFLLGSGERPAGIVNEVPGTYYYPEGLTLYSDASDPSSAVTMKQSIVISVKNVEERNGHRILLTGIGDGPFEMRATYGGARGPSQTFGGVKGNIIMGQRIEVAGSALQPTTEGGEIVREGRRDSVLVEQTPWKVEVEIDWIADALTAWAIGRESSAPSQSSIEQAARQAAVPKMLEFLRLIEIRDGVTFGKLMKDDPSLVDRIKRLLLRTRATAVERTKEGDVTVDLRLPMKSLRAALPPGQYP